MKKFSFSMETILRYRDQLLEARQIEHAAALAQVREKEAVVAALREKFHEVNLDYRERKAVGMTIADAYGFELALETQENAIKQALAVLAECRREEEKRRAAVIAAKTDKAVLEKLKEKKIASYQKAVQKSEEQFIDEFVSTARVMAGAAQ